MKKRIITLIVVCALFLTAFLCALAEESEPLLRAGDILVFGCFEQDGDASNGAEPIHWRILSAGEDRAILISREALLGRAIDESGKAWADSSLRDYLNGEFLTSAFTDAERSELFADNSGDSVTILTKAEAESCFQANEDRSAKMTAAAEQELGFRFQNDAIWWLRDGEVIESRGVVLNTQLDTSRAIAGVRPVIFLGYAYFESRYAEAKALLDAGSFDAAADAFAAISCYGDAAEQLAAIPYLKGKQALEDGDLYTAYRLLSDAAKESKEAAELLETDPSLHVLLHSADEYSVGGEIVIGSYGNAILDWKIVNKHRTRLTLISNYAVTTAAYDDEAPTATWENCSLRRWLNGAFLDEAFTQDERACLTTGTTSDLVALPDYESNIWRQAFKKNGFKVMVRIAEPGNNPTGIWTLDGGQLSGTGDYIRHIDATTAKGMAVRPVIVIDTAGEGWQARLAAKADHRQQDESQKQSTAGGSEEKTTPDTEDQAVIERVDIYIGDELANGQTIQVTQLPIYLRWEAVGNAEIASYHIAIYTDADKKPIVTQDQTEIQARIPRVAAGTEYRLTVSAIPVMGGEAEMVTAEAQFVLTGGQ